MFNSHRVYSNLRGYMCTNILNWKPRKFAYFLTHRVLQDWFWSNLDFNCIPFKQHNILGEAIQMHWKWLHFNFWEGSKSWYKYGKAHIIGRIFRLRWKERKRHLSLQLKTWKFFRILPNWKFKAKDSSVCKFLHFFSVADISCLF